MRKVSLKGQIPGLFYRDEREFTKLMNVNYMYVLITQCNTDDYINLSYNMYIIHVNISAKFKGLGAEIFVHYHKF